MAEWNGQEGGMEGFLPLWAILDLNRVTLFMNILTIRNIIFKQLYLQPPLSIRVRQPNHLHRQRQDKRPNHLPQQTRRSHTISQHLTLPVSLDLPTLQLSINRSYTTNPSTMFDTRRLSRNHVRAQVDWDTVWMRMMKSG
jgi:hypothetical protein